MPTVTNGTVEYSRNVKVADYENKSFKVSLSFTVGEGEDHVAATDAIGQEAVAITHAKLGLTQPVQEPTAVKGKPRKASATPSQPTAATSTPASTEAAKPGLMDDEPTEAATAAVSEPTTSASAAPISDKQLTDALTKAKARGATKDQLREAIVAFAERMSEIPQEKRGAFLGVLESLPAGQ